MLDLTTFDCTGCTACYSVCPHKAIQMVEDAEGFKFPQIDGTKCTNCGLCEKVCVPSNGYEKPSFTAQAYGAKNKRLDERKKSQSGGAFYILAKNVLSQNGVVYGAQIDEGCIVRHSRACTESEVKAFRGSKYVQSDLGDVFLQVKEDLLLGVPVLFSGAPCQVAGLKSFLRKDYENLLLVDLICHGVPSPKVWSDYLTWQQERLNRKITNPNFRDKEFGWERSYESFYVHGKKKRFDVYSRIFHSLNAHRKSCYVCPFTNTERVSDITIGDFWGIENTKPEFKDEYGVSAVLVNSAKGQRVWGEVRGNFDYFECKVEDIMARNPHLSKPVDKPATRETFWNDYEKGFSLVAKKYGVNNLKGKLKKVIKRILGRR